MDLFRKKDFVALSTLKLLFYNPILMDEVVKHGEVP